MKMKILADFQICISVPLSFVEPHKAISTSTIPCWTQHHTKIFTPHSTRSASSFKAKILDVSTKKNLKKIHWSKATTFDKFYRKEILMDYKK